MCCLYSPHYLLCMQPLVLHGQAQVRLHHTIVSAQWPWRGVHGRSCPCTQCSPVQHPSRFNFQHKKLLLHLCRLERAIKQVQEQTPDATFQVQWLPYQLNPAAGDEPINKLQYYNDKFGPARVAQMMPAMTVSAAQHTRALCWRLVSLACSSPTLACRHSCAFGLPTCVKS